MFRRFLTLVCDFTERLCGEIDGWLPFYHCELAQFSFWLEIKYDLGCWCREEHTFTTGSGSWTVVST